MTLFKDMDPQKRKAILIGAIIGATLTLTISLMMDFLYSDAVHGTWRDAISHDARKYLSMEIAPNSALAYVLFVIVLGLMGGIGALMGMLFMYVMYKFFSMLST